MAVETRDIPTWGRFVFLLGGLIALGGVSHFRIGENAKDIASLQESGKSSIQIDHRLELAINDLANEVKNLSKSNGDLEGAIDKLQQR